MLTFLAGSYFCYEGYDKKNHYENSEYSWRENINAYVGGDAYNYIINSNYYTGYNVLGIGCFLISLLGLTGSAILGRLDESNMQSEEYYEFIYNHPLFKDSNKNKQNLKEKKFSSSDWGSLPDLKSTNSDGAGSPKESAPETPKPQYDTAKPPSDSFVRPAASQQNYPQSMQQAPNYQWSQATYPYSQSSQTKPISQYSGSYPNTYNSNQPAGNSQRLTDKENNQSN